MRFYLTIALGYLVLDLYFNLIPILVNLNTVMWILYAVAFFPLAHYLVKLTGLNGLHALGLKFHNGWKRNLMFGFAIGFTFWLGMEGILYASHTFSVVGIKGLSAGIFFMLQALVGLFLGSLINDIIVRGYVFAHLKNKVNLPYLLLISAFVYAIDDLWYEGFSIHNTLFSIILGLSLGYVFLKSGSIWMTTGIHWGLNIVYCIFYGIPGRESNKGLLLIERYNISSFFIDNISILVAFFMFIFIMIGARHPSKRESLKNRVC
ncbi:CPBP family intramembrane glutamic endopeptidase [Sporosarcina sp. 179-K 3D1 HS]|uniref:CPBP family intramembrane glutamic endopeptidase n=1 Tax=Sporosarcina sp. 179-K 3D1 HS TaxID=3232169 RepID=UPI0039A2D47D